VVTAGLTFLLPLAATVPMDWSMLTVVASVVVQARLAVPPLVITVGVAVMLTVGRRFTVTVAVCVAVPKEFDTVKV